MNELYRNLRMKMFATPGVSLTALKASGNRIQTVEFGELYDFESGCWASVLGHGRKEITQAICENAGFISHTHQFFDTEHPGSLVRELTEAAELNNLFRGTFTSSGSEAVSLAVMLAELITHRHKKLSLSISYLGASPDLRLPRNPLQWLDLDISGCLNCTKDSSCRECGRYRDVDFSDIAAFVFEPGNSGGLVICPPEKLITFLSVETRNAGGFVISNEVTTGFGRTGKWFGFQHYGYFNSKSYSPDFISMGKGLGNGYPVSGLLIRSELAEIVESTGFRYVQSHMDDPLGCIIARKVVEVMSKENLVGTGNINGRYLLTKLAETGTETGQISEVRGRGMMNALILKEGIKVKEVFRGLLEKGFFVGYSEAYNLLRFYPPLITQPDDIDALCHALKSVLQPNH